MEEIKLTITIEYERPLTLSEFSQSLESWNNQYKKHTKSEDFLLIKEIRHGSIIIDLVQYTLPFIKDFNALRTFFDYIKSRFEWLKNKEGNKPPMDIEDCDDIQKTIAPINNHEKAKINIAVNGDNNIVNNTMYVVESNDVKKIIASANEEKLKLESKCVVESSNNYNNVLLRFIQLKNEDKDNKNTKGIIEEIDKKAYPILFAKNIKNRVLHNHENPFLLEYLVSVKVNKRNGKIVSYTIIELIDMSIIEVAELENKEPDLFSKSNM